MLLLDPAPAHMKLHLAFIGTQVGAFIQHEPLLRSVQGYGRRSVAPNDGWVYPGSGATADSQHLPLRPPVAPLAAGVAANGILGAQALAAGAAGACDSAAGPNGVEEDPEAEFVGDNVECPPADGPRIINVGIPGPGKGTAHRFPSGWFF